MWTDKILPLSIKDIHKGIAKVIRAKHFESIWHQAISQMPWTKWRASWEKACKSQREQSLLQSVLVAIFCTALRRGKENRFLSIFWYWLALSVHSAPFFGFPSSFISVNFFGIPLLTYTMNRGYHTVHTQRKLVSFRASPTKIWFYFTLTPKQASRPMRDHRH